MRLFEHEEIINHEYKTVATIVFAEVLSVLVLLMLIWGMPLEEQLVADAVLNILWGGILAIAIAVVFLRRFLLSERRIREKAKGDIKAVIGALKFNTILLTTLAESVAILGFLITILSGEKTNFLRAAVVSFLLFLITFPRKFHWKRIIQQQQSFQSYERNL